MVIKCLLCSSEKTLQIDKVNTFEIAQLYKKTYGGILFEEFDKIISLSYLECTQCGLHFFSPPVTGSERFYNLQNKSENYYLGEKHEYAYAKKFINSTHSVLEIGCGKGFFLNHIEPKSYIGLEFSDDAIKFARDKNLNVIKDDIQHYAKITNQLFDVVCCFQVLEHVSNPNSFIQSAINCLKRDGIFIVSVPNNDTYLSILPNALANLPPHHVTRWPVRALESIGTIFNLDIISIDYELLSDLHLKGFSNAVALKVLGSAKEDLKIIDTSFSGRIKRGFAFRYLSPFIARFFRDTRIRPRGHSVTAVFRKR